jgi:hypothetical protein
MKNGTQATVFLLLACVSQVALAASPDGRRWAVTAKSCGEISVSVEFPEEYAFSRGLLAHISVAEDSATKQCKRVVAHLRQPDSFGTTGDTYTENASLLSSMVRIICWNKVGGELVSPPLSDETKGIPEQVSSLSLSSHGKALSMSIEGSAECPADTLQIEAVEK